MTFGHVALKGAQVMTAAGGCHRTEADDGPFAWLVAEGKALQRSILILQAATQHSPTRRCKAAAHIYAAHTGLCANEGFERSAQKTSKSQNTVHGP